MGIHCLSIQFCISAALETNTYKRLGSPNKLPTMDSNIIRYNVKVAKMNKQRKQPLAIHGLEKANIQAASYTTFRQHLYNINTSSVSNRQGTTLIYNQQKKVCALVKPPYFDSRGQCQPVRYFLVDASYSCTPKFSLLKKPSVAISLFNQRVYEDTTCALKIARQVFKKCFSQKTTTIVKRKRAPVWTTMRLTA